MSPPCSTPIPEAGLTAYWLGELDDSDAAEVEQHLFGCSQCSSQLKLLVRLGVGIRQIASEGTVHAVLSPAFVRQMQNNGLRVREYRLQPGTSVACTIAPDDDLVVSHLHAEFADVERLDLVFEDPDSGAQLRMQDLAFDRTSDEIVLASNTRYLRELGTATRRVRLLAVRKGGDRELGTYTFNHSRYRPSFGPGSGPGSGT